MAQLTHDTAAEDGFHEIQLSGKQLVFLFMATTVVSVVIFLCGVLVGRNARIESEAPPAIDTAAVAPSDEEPAAGVPSVTEAPTPVPAEELDYRKRLEEGKKEALKESSQQPKPVPPPATPAPAAASPPEEAAPDVPTSGKPGVWVIQVQALSSRAAASAAVKRLIAKGYPAFLQMPAKGTAAIYRVQIGRFKERREAEQVSRRLEKEEQFEPDIKR